VLLSSARGRISEPFARRSALISDGFARSLRRSRTSRCARRTGRVRPGRTAPAL
jgi:hypothetical protein